MSFDSAGAAASGGGARAAPRSGFEVSVKFLRSFSEIEILRKFHEIYDFSEIYDFWRQHSSARACVVPGRGQVSNFECTGYISTENMKFI